MLDKHTIIKLKLEGQSIRGIARMLKVDRKTVTKYWKDYKNQLTRLKTEPENSKTIQEEIFSEPTYNSANRKPVKYTSEIDKRLEELLDEEQRKNQLLGQHKHKQKRTKQQIYDQFKSEGYDSSYKTIARKISVKQK